MSDDMYDDIDFSACPDCGRPIEGWEAWDVRWADDFLSAIGVHHECPEGGADE